MKTGAVSRSRSCINCLSLPLAFLPGLSQGTLVRFELFLVKRCSALKKRGSKKDMLRLLVRWILDAIALLIVAWLVPGFKVANLPSALIAVIVIGLLNVTLGLLLKLITLPLGILTLGLFFLVINALILKLASGVVPGFYVNTFGAAFIGAAVLALLHMLFEALSS